jgi:hypothetical protein
MTREIDDALFLTKHEHWQCWPVCPVKRYDKDEKHERHTWPTCGIVWAAKPTVLVVNMFAISGMNFSMAKEAAEAVHEYASFDDMVADGWIVD